MNKTIRFMLGWFCILFGILIYMLLREHTLFINSTWAIIIIQNIPELWKDSGPAFTHCCGIILISSPFIGGKKTHIYILILFWITTEIFFELGQKFPDTFSEFIPNNSIQAYFQNGTFDINDIYMAVTGAVAAFTLYKLFPDKKT